MTTTLTSAIQTVMAAANTQTCLTPELREAMRIVASKAQYSGEDKDEVQALKELIKHCQIHSAYSNCGYQKMDQDMRRLYDAVDAEDVFEDD